MHAEAVCLSPCWRVGRGEGGTRLSMEVSQKAGPGREGLCPGPDVSLWRKAALPGTQFTQATPQNSSKSFPGCSHRKARPQQLRNPLQKQAGAGGLLTVPRNLGSSEVSTSPSCSSWALDEPVCQGLHSAHLAGVQAGEARMAPGSARDRARPRQRSVKGQSPSPSLPRHGVVFSVYSK